MATFTYVPDYGATREIKPNVRVAQFGDGYEQRLANGLNTQAKKWTLSFPMRSDTEADGIEAFLAARGAVESFDWTDPTGNAGKYVCRAWVRRTDQYGLNTIECQFEQVFEP